MEMGSSHIPAEAAASRPRLWRSTLHSPLAKAIGVAFLVILVLFLWWNMVRRALSGPSSQINDFIRFSRHLLFEGRNVYDEYEATYTITKYPPFFAFLFAPLVALPMAIAASIWYWLNLALAVAAAWLSSLVVEERPNQWRGQRSPVVAPFVLVAPVVISNLQTGQVNIVIVFLLMLSLVLFRRRRDLAAGAVLGAITALKLTPALFLVYFAWKRELRVLAGAAAGLFVCWLVLPVVVWGPDRAIEITQSWLTDVAPFLTEGTRAEGIGGFRHTNQSLSAALHRFLTETPAGAGREGLYLNVASIRETAAWIVRVLSVAIVLLLAWICRSGTGDRSRIALSFEYALVMIAILFLSPISWINHYVILIFPFAVAWHYVATRPASSGDRRLLACALAASFTLLLTSVSRLLQAYSLPFLGALVLAIAIAVILRSEGMAEPLGRP